MLNEGEYLEDMQREGLQIIQSREGYRFSSDAVLLAHFTASFSLRGRVVDLGTGSGVILLLLSALCPEAEFLGLEIQEAVADMARRSVAINGLESRIRILHGDLRETEKFISPGSADAVVSNPPFIPKNAGPENLRKDITLSRQELACCLEDIFRASQRVLKNRGRLFLVHRPERLGDICVFGRQYGLEPKVMRMVMPRPGGEPNMVLFQCTKQASPGMKILPPLILTDENGNTSAEVAKMYLSSS